MRKIKLNPIKHVLDEIHHHFNDVVLGSEKLSLLDARHRYASEDIHSNMTIPPYRKSTVDGYAIKHSSDIQKLKIKNQKEISAVEADYIEDMTIYVPTGGRVPIDAEAVIKIEETKEADGYRIIEPCLQSENIIQIGEDLKLNECVISKDQKLTTFDIGVLASLGQTEVKVYKKPTLGIISTGDELIPIDGQYDFGKTRDINGMTLKCLADDYGLEVVYQNLINDDYETLKNAILESHKLCDITIVSGGSSMGEKDYTFDILGDIGTVITDGIALKPGKPTIVSKKDEKPILGLPGHPVSAIMVFKILMPTILRKYGIFLESQKPFKAILMNDVRPAKGRDTYQMLHFVEGDQMEAHSTSGKSGMMTLLTKSEGYTIVDKNSILKKGDLIECYKF